MRWASSEKLLMLRAALQIVRLAKKLPQGDVRAMAGEIGARLSVGGEHHGLDGDEEEDLT